MNDTSELDRVPIPSRLVRAVATHHGVDETHLGEALAAIHTDLVDGADAIQKHYRESGEYPLSLETADGLAAVLFVPPELWGGPAVSEFSERTCEAAKAVHEAFARELGADEETLATHAASVVPSETMSRLVRAGLSRRQAEVQVLRRRGLTQAEIGERLGLATNTVKVHCHRIDTKRDDARLLLELTEA